jgi:hypothetical protein
MQLALMMFINSLGEWWSPAAEFAFATGPVGILARTAGAAVVELVYTRGLGPRSARIESSSLSRGTICTGHVPPMAGC